MIMAAPKALVAMNERSEKEEAMTDQKFFINHNWESITDDAKLATGAEHNLSLFQALKTHRKAVGWSVLVSMTLIMEGYDTQLIGSFFGYPSFQKKYGNYYPGVGYQLSGPWQIALGLSSGVGSIFGVFFNGILIDRFGYRKVVLVALVFMAAFISLPFAAPNITVLLIGEILCGIPWGIFATMGPAYASEVCPLVLRGYLTTYVNLCWTIGQFIGAGVIDGLVGNSTEWSYRIPFAVQWVWPLPLFCGLWFAPESPWWLVRKGRLVEAEHSVKRLSSKSVEANSRQTVALMVHTNNLELEIETGSTYLDCFKGSNLRRTEIVCVATFGQIMDGAPFAASPTYFLEQAGVATSNAYKLAVGGTAVAFCGTILSWFLMTRFGRRKIYVSGMAGQTLLLFLIGILSIVPTSSSGTVWGQAALTICWLLVNSLTVAPILNCIISETSATRLRRKTICLGRNSYNLLNIVSSILEPYLINPTEWNLKGKTAFFWFGAALSITIWSYFRLPEAKGRTYEELDILFANRVSARKFSKTTVDPYAENEGLILKVE